VPRRSNVDYDALEKLYVTEDHSYASLAKIGGVTPQSVGEYAKRNDWAGKKMAYKAALARRGYEVVAESVAFKGAQIKEEAIAVARATLRRYASDIVEGKVPVTAKDAAEMIRLLIKELSPEETRDDRGAPIVIEGAERPDSDFLRRVVEAARGRVDPAGSVEKSIQVRAGGTRPN